MERHELSPHDETILFQLVEIERNLPREEQSRRFQVKIASVPGEAPKALIKPATSSSTFLLKTDGQCFGALEAMGYINGGRHTSFSPRGTRGSITIESLSTVHLLESAFGYYDDKHDFPTSLADERREFVDNRISTHYPEVVAYLKKAYDAIWVDQPENNWSSVAHDCQDALKTFANSIYKTEYSAKLNEEEPSSADFEEKIDIIIRANAFGPSQEEFRKLLASLNKYMNARRHDSGTTRDEAKRCVLYTYLIVSEIHTLIKGTD